MNKSYWVINFRGTMSKWQWLLVQLIAIAILLVGIFSGYFLPESVAKVVFIIAIIYAFLLAASSVVRRLHDVGASGFWVLAYWIPIVNFYVFYLLWIKIGLSDQVET